MNVDKLLPSCYKSCLIDKLIIHSMDLVGNVLPAKMLHGPSGRCMHLCPEGRIPQEHIELRCKETRRAWNQIACLTMMNDCCKASCSRRYNGRSTGQRLDSDQTK